MTQVATPDTEFTAMERAEAVLKALALPDGSSLPHVSTGKNEPILGEFFATYFISDRNAVTDMDGPEGYLSATRVQVIAFAKSQRRAFDLAKLAREELEKDRFERVGNASVIQRDKLVGVTRDYLFLW